MYHRVSCLLVLSIFGAMSSQGDQLTVAAKGKMEKTKTFQGTLVEFHGSKLQFRDKRQNHVVSYSAENSEITITLGNGQTQAPIDPERIRTASSYLPADHQTPVDPDVVTYSYSKPSATKDVDLQKAEVQKRAEFDVAPGQTVEKEPQIAWKPSICHGRGEDRIETTLGIERLSLSGKVISISNGVLTFQKKGASLPQKFLLYSEVTAIWIGMCN